MKLFKHAHFAAWALLVVGIPVLGQGVPSPSELSAYQLDKAAMASNPGLTAIPGSILVKFRENTPAGDRGGLLAGMRSRLVRTFPLVAGLAHVRTDLPTEQVIQALAASPWVEFAEPDYVVHPVATTPNDTYYGLQWGLNNTGQAISGVTGVADADIDMPEAWDMTTGQPDFVVAVIDTGTQWDHPDLDGNIWTNPGEIPGNGIDDDGNGYVDDVRGWDFYAGDNNPTDEDGHGTHTAGTIGAEGGNGIGVAGIAWGCKIMPLRFIGPYGGSTADAVAAVNYAVAKGVKVSNNSWGGGGYSTSLYNAIKNAQAVGHVFVAAAGNSGANTDLSPQYPAGYDLPNIVSVAAMDNRDGLASFSNYGATSVDIGAPGVNIASTYLGSQYYYSSGTSMAAPHVAGVAALVYQQNPTFTYAQVVDRILGTARPVASLAGKCRSGGVLNAYAAVTGGGANASPSVSISAPLDNSTVASGTLVTLTGAATDPEDGSLSGGISWSSSLSGALGTGPTLGVVLPEGAHTITATVTDSGGRQASATAKVTVVSLPAAPGGVAAVNNRNNTATVSWTDNAINESSFQVWRQTRASNGTYGKDTYINVAALSGTGKVSLTDRSGSGTFRYCVRARNAQGNSAWSAWSLDVKVTSK